MEQALGRSLRNLFEQLAWRISPAAVLGVLCNRLKLSTLVILPAVLMLQDVCLYNYYSDIYAARSLVSVSSRWHRVLRIRMQDSQNRRRSSDNGYSAGFVPNTHEIQGI